MTSFCKLTWDTSPWATTVNFFDLTISIVDQKLETQVFSKKQSLHHFLLPHSYQATKKVQKTYHRNDLLVFPPYHLTRKKRYIHHSILLSTLYLWIKKTKTTYNHSFWEKSTNTSHLLPLPNNLQLTPKPLFSSTQSFIQAIPHKKYFNLPSLTPSSNQYDNHFSHISKISKVVTSQTKKFSSATTIKSPWKTCCFYEN